MKRVYSQDTIDQIGAMAMKMRPAEVADKLNMQRRSVQNILTHRFGGLKVLRAGKRKKKIKGIPARAKAHKRPIDTESMMWDVMKCDQLPVETRRHLIRLLAKEL